MASGGDGTNLCSLKFNNYVLNRVQTLSVDYIKSDFEVDNTLWKFQLMLFDVSAISERMNI